MRGALHLRHGLPNQDAVLWRPIEDASPSGVIAVADGHGSNRCFRSQIGAALAAGVGLDAVDEVLGSPAPDQIVPERLAADISERWRADVGAHLERHPFTVEELGRLEEAEGADTRAEVEAGPLLAYGTTLLVAGADDRSIVALQIGDGDILTVDRHGIVARPLPPDPRSVGNATASLARSTSADDARARVLSMDEDGPVLVMASTDGYANSFEEDAGFLQVGSDLLRMIHSEGLAAVSDELEGWLAEASELGSGDDVSLGLLAAEPLSLS